MKINQKCIICGFTQNQLIKYTNEGGMMAAVFPTDADGTTEGKARPLCKNCFIKLFLEER